MIRLYPGLDPRVQHIRNFRNSPDPRDHPDPRPVPRFCKEQAVREWFDEDDDEGADDESGDVADGEQPSAE